MIHKIYINTFTYTHKFSKRIFIDLQSCIYSFQFNMVFFAKPKASCIWFNIKFIVLILFSAILLHHIISNSLIFIKFLYYNLTHNWYDCVVCIFLSPSLQFLSPCVFVCACMYKFFVRFKFDLFIRLSNPISFIYIIILLFFNLYTY